MTIVNIRLRDDATGYEPTPDGEGAIPITVGGYHEDVDLDQLTPRARTLAEAIAQRPSRSAGDIWVEHEKPIRESIADWSNWYTEEEASQPERRPWRGWAAFPATSSMTAIEYLEREAQKIPANWHVLGATPQTPVPSKDEGAADRYLTRDQVLAYMRARGRDISVSTWSAYTSKKRRQAPPPDHHVGRTPQWKPETIDSFLAGTWKGATTDPAG
ncbi:hypothetical protein JBE04_02095 [Streptomyces sp. PRKS01-29]|nr:hypothetical protein [Streptomyces sabulosicollis]MBI0293320.1 hypothetical protein [Streptomyces sabulosicollis]